MYKNEEMYGESIEFYDIAALPHSNVNESILKKFARMTDMNEGVIVDIGAGTGRNIMELPIVISITQGFTSILKAKS